MRVSVSSGVTRWASVMVGVMEQVGVRVTERVNVGTVITGWVRVVVGVTGTVSVRAVITGRVDVNVRLWGEDEEGCVWVMGLVSGRSCQYERWHFWFWHNQMLLLLVPSRLFNLDSCKWPVLTSAVPINLCPVFSI